jgi:quercetin dioxygenase-like cupin family protein
MRAFRSGRQWLALLGVVAVASAFGAGVAFATVTTDVVSDTSDVRLRIQHNEFIPSPDQPRFSTGWHTHPGLVIVQVHEGQIKLTNGATCHPTVVGAGETYIETPDHPDLAEINKPTRWTVTFIQPAGATDLLTPTNNPC